MVAGIELKVEGLIEIARAAGDIIMHYYNQPDLEVEQKEDSSPVTEADRESSDFIIKELTKLYPDIPVVSEENPEAGNLKIIKKHKVFWLIDPIDGTWSFIRKRGYFTVNIALVEDGEPVWGVIYSPLDKTNYYCQDDKAYKVNFRGDAKEIKPKKVSKDGADFLISSHNLNQSTAEFVEKFDVKSMTPIPSSIKFCLMAEGKGDIYPRFKDTSIWDTAAGHAILRAVGGEIVSPGGKPLVYNHGALLNPNFIAVTSPSLLEF